VRLPISLHDELKNVADTRDVSVNYLVIRAVSDYLVRADVSSGRNGDRAAGGTDDQRRPRGVRRSVGADR
jgi:hypothetical protein